MSHVLTISAVSGCEKRFVEICLQHISVALEAPAPDESRGAIFFSRKIRNNFWLSRSSPNESVNIFRVDLHAKRRKFLSAVDWVSCRKFLSRWNRLDFAWNNKSLGTQRAARRWWMFAFYGLKWWSTSDNWLNHFWETMEEDSSLNSFQGDCAVKVAAFCDAAYINGRQLPDSEQK